MRASTFETKSAAAFAGTLILAALIAAGAFRAHDLLRNQEVLLHDASARRLFAVRDLDLAIEREASAFRTWLLFQRQAGQGEMDRARAETDEQILGILSRSSHPSFARLTRRLEESLREYRLGAEEVAGLRVGGAGLDDIVATWGPDIIDRRARVVRDLHALAAWEEAAVRSEIGGALDRLRRVDRLILVVAGLGLTLAGALMWVLTSGLARALRATREAREHTEAARAFTDALLAAAPVAFVCLGPDLRCGKVNGSFASMAGRSGTELEGRTLGEALPSLASRLDPLVRRVLDTGVPIREAEVEGTAWGRAERTGWFLVHAYPVPGDGHTVRAVGLLLVDVTQRHRAEEAARSLAQQNAELLDEAREANRRKDRFLATLGHELRTPMSGILNALEILERRGSAAEEDRRYRGVIVRQARHVTRLVGDLLDVARIGSGRIDVVRVPHDLADDVRRARDAHDGEAMAKHHDVRVSLPGVPVWVDGDPDRLAQVVSNLLGNAIKYTPPSGRIQVALRTDPGTGESVLSVIDTGPGIPQSLRERIWDPFYQVERGAGGGLGLGLAVVREIVSLHGGRIGVRCDGPDSGCTFELRLPPASAAPPVPAPERAPPRPACRRILVVEDDTDARETLRTLLELDGHRVVAAATGPDGVRAAERESPDLALVDIGLPGFDGYEVARRIRALPGAPPYLVAMTGYGRPEDREAAEAAGYDAHVVKPVDSDALARLLSRPRGRPPPDSPGSPNAAAAPG